MEAFSTFPAFADAFRVLLMERAELADVKVFTAAVASPEELGPKSIVIAYDEVTATYAYVQGPSLIVDESYEIECTIDTAVVGAGEDGIKAARDETFAILKQVHSALAEASATSAGSESTLAAWDARIIGWKMVQVIPAPTVRSCQLSFRVAVKARFTPSTS